MEIADIIIDGLKACSFSVLGLTIGANLAEYERMIKTFRNDVFRSKDYEDSLKNKKFNSFGDFMRYYYFYPGRYYARKEFDNPSNWR